MKTDPGQARCRHKKSSTGRNSKADRSDEVFPATYLAAKKYIDDAALNANVWQTLVRALPTGRVGEPLQILEVGAGIGTMLVRMVERNLFTGPVRYRVTDNYAPHLPAAKGYLTGRAEELNLRLSWSSEQCGRLLTSKADITIILEDLDLREIAGRAVLPGVCDLVIAHGVLDLFDASQVLPLLFRLLKTGGLFYNTCNFDGETIFLPEHPADQEIVRCYHESMDRRIRGASHTGRRLLAHLQDHRKEIIAAGSADWVVHPGSHGYTEAQKFFLLAFIDMVEQALTESPEKIPALTAWTKRRRQQIADGRLFFLAKHLDMLARHASI